MDKNLYVEKLSYFKQNEKPEVVLLLVEKPDLIKIVVAWTSLDIKQENGFSVVPGDSESEAWEWLWENVTYSLRELKDKIGVSLSERVLERKVKFLIGNRIIYPDGTVNSFIERYLRERVIKLFEIKPQRRESKE